MNGQHHQSVSAEGDAALTRGASADPDVEPVLPDALNNAEPFVEHLAKLGWKRKGRRLEKTSDARSVYVRMSLSYCDRYRSSGAGWKERLDAHLETLIDAGKYDTIYSSNS